MTWKEFKEALESEGVTDDMEIDYIDVTEPYGVSITVYDDNSRFSVE